MPSVWTFVGVDARTALTVYVFQVRTASGGDPTGFCVLRRGRQRHRRGHATRRTSTVGGRGPFFIVLLLGRDRLDDADGIEPGALRGKRSLRPDGASKTKKQISSSGTWIERSKRTRCSARVSSSAAERARRSRASRSPAWPRAR